MKPIILLVALGLILSACGAPQPAPIVATAVTADSPAYAKLALIESESPRPPVALVEAFRVSMDSLSKKCHGETPEHLAALIIKSQELLREKNIDVKLSEIARQVDRSLPADAQIAQCSDVFAAFVTLTINQSN